MKCDNDRSLCEHPAWSEDRSLLEGSPLDRARWLLSSEGWEHDAAALDEYVVQLARQLAQSADALRAAEERAKTAEWLLVRAQQHIQETTGDEALLSWIGRELELAAPRAIPDTAAPVYDEMDIADINHRPGGTGARE